MSINRHKKLGIKQLIRLEWMDKVVSLLLAGMSETEIRNYLDVYLSTQKQSGGQGERGKKTYGMAINILASWFSPAKELLGLRNNSLDLARNLPIEMWLPLHWAVISASYPFWFNVAKQVGRLLNLQDKITQRQIFDRMKEQYGDRETVARNARYTVRSFIAWGLLKDSDSRGSYEKGSQIEITDYNEIIILLESSLHVSEAGQGQLDLLLNNPGFFPFRIPIITGDIIDQKSIRIDVVSYGLDNKLLKLKE